MYQSAGWSNALADGYPRSATPLDGYGNTSNVGPARRSTVTTSTDMVKC